MTFEVYQFPRWTFAMSLQHIDSQNANGLGSPPFLMGRLTITDGIDMPQATGQADTFGFKGFVSVAGDTDNSLLGTSGIWGATGWREYLVQMPTNPGKCKGAYKLDFRYSVVDTQDESDVHTQSIDFEGPTDISLTRYKNLDDSS